MADDGYEQRRLRHWSGNMQAAHGAGRSEDFVIASGNMQAAHIAVSKRRNLIVRLLRHTKYFYLLTLLWLAMTKPVWL